MNMHPDCEKILISQEEIEQKVTELAKTLDCDYAGKKPLFVCILKGSFMFFSDLVKKLNIDMEVDFMSVASYGLSTRSSGEVKLIKDLDKSIEGKDVVLVEDIVDSGYTLSYLKRMLASRHPASIKICTFLDKFERREVDIQTDYKAFDIGNEFVIGYGLDYAQRYRNLPYVAILKREVYEK